MAHTIAPYHRLGLTERRQAFSSWRPAVAIAVVLVGFALLQVVWVVAAAAVLGLDWLDAFVNDDGSDVDPTTMFVTYGAIAVTAPMAFVAAWGAGPATCGRLRGAGGGANFCPHSHSWAGRWR